MNRTWLPIMSNSTPEMRWKSNPVPSPPSAGERARVRGRSASQRHQSVASTPLTSKSSQSPARSVRPLTPTLSPADGGEGAGISCVSIAIATGAATP